MLRFVKRTQSEWHSLCHELPERLARAAAGECPQAEHGRARQNGQGKESAHHWRRRHRR